MTEFQFQDRKEPGRGGGNQAKIIARFKRVLTILQTCRYSRATVGELTRMCGVSERTIFRDMKFIGELGFLIKKDKSRCYRCATPTGLIPQRLDADNVQTLLLLLLDAAKTRNVPGSENIGDAVRTFMSLLPESLLEQACASIERIHIRREPVHSCPKSKQIFTQIRETMKARQAVRIVYHDSGTTPVQTLFHPYALVFGNHAWHVIGYSFLYREIRLFTLSSITSVEPSYETYVIPDSFSPETYFRDAWGIRPGRLYHVAVRFSSVVAREIAEIDWHPNQHLEWNPITGTLLFHVQVSGLEEIASWILQYGREAEVLEPLELRKMIRDHAMAMAKKYDREKT